MTRQYLDMLWKLLDEILNAVLFVLVGLEALVLDGRTALPVGLVAIVLMPPGRQ